MNRISILVVDDASDTLDVIAQCLSTTGHEVTCASGGRQAISLMEEQHFDLVITDLLMPDSDGMQVIMAARKTQPDASVVAMSGGGEYFPARYLLKLATALGADGQLMKPFTRTQLLDTVDQVCGSHSEFVGAA